MPKRPYISASIKKKVAKRANALCEYCKCPKKYAPGPFDIEHTVPLSKGGSSSLDNLAYACNGCNGIKYNKIYAIDPADGKSVRLYNPRKNDWSDHFMWSDTGLLVIGITSIGRATVNLLELNREELLNIRSILHLIGEHPPNDS